MSDEFDPTIVFIPGNFIHQHVVVICDTGMNPRRVVGPVKDWWKAQELINSLPEPNRLFTYSLPIHATVDSTRTIYDGQRQI